MRSRRGLASVVLALIVTLALMSSAMAGPRNFKAHLSGGEEVPSVDTNSTGQANFKLSKDGTELSYKLIVANIENVTMAHIHCAPAGANGSVVVWLYGPGPTTSNSGVLAEGTITDGDVISSALCGDSLEDLVAAMSAGNAYVNVHTTANPGGEIRGQIR